MASASQAPKKVALVNLADTSSIKLQYNPPQLAEKIYVNYAHLQIFGQSHQQLNYTSTMNHELTLKASFDELTQSGPQKYNVPRARRFLMSLCYPRRDSVDIRSGAPPRVLIIWPKLVSMQAKVVQLEFSHERFAADGHPTYFLATIHLEEVRDVRLFSEDVAEFGTQRPNLPDPGVV